MFSNLSQKQVFFLGIISVVLCITIVPSLKIWFNSLTSKEYEPWDPDNINVIKDKIKELNEESKQLKFEADVLPAFQNEIAGNIQSLSKTELDTPYINTLLQVQPYYMMPGVDRFYAYNPGSIDPYRRIRSGIYSQINSKRQLYSKEYTKLCEGLGYKSFYEINAEVLVQPSNFSAITPMQPNSADTSRVVPFTSYTLGIPIDQGRYRSLADAKVRYAAVKSQLVAVLNSLDTLLTRHQTSIDKRKAALIIEQNLLKDEFNRKNFNINQFAVIIGIPFFIISALLMYWYGLRSNKAEGTSSEHMMHPRDKLSFALNTITVLLLILSLLILGLAKVISENALAALLGTIGGYVLNNSKEKQEATPSTPSNFSDRAGKTV